MLKKRYLRKISITPKNRLVWMTHPSKIKKVLLVTDEENKSAKKACEELFSNASVHHLFERPIKADTTKGFYYSVHQSDFNLTGKLKNDKLINLSKMEFDLLIDLSDFKNKELAYFVASNRAGLKVGDISSSDKKTYDLFIDLGKRNEITIQNIHSQIEYLTRNEQV